MHCHGERGQVHVKRKQMINEVYVKVNVVVKLAKTGPNGNQHKRTQMAVRIKGTKCVLG